MKDKEAVHMNLMYSAIESCDDGIYGRRHTMYFDPTSTISYIGIKNYKEWYKHKTTIQCAKPTIITVKEIVCHGKLYSTEREGCLLF